MYYTGRRHAGENLEALLTKREPGREKPLVMSDALSSNNAEEDGPHPLSLSGAWAAASSASWTRTFPAESAVVVDALKLVYDHDEEARDQAAECPGALGVSSDAIVRPCLRRSRRGWSSKRQSGLVEPNSSLGKAIAYHAGALGHADAGLKEPGAPLDNNVAERALKLAIRQRKNSLFYATEHSAYIASILTSVIATCVQAGVNALDYLVAVQDHRQEVFANPSAWLPWNYEAALVPS